MIDKIIKIILIATFIISVVTYSGWSYIKEYTGLKIFYPCTALMFVGYTYVIFLFAKKAYFNDRKNRFIVFFTRIIYLTTVNNLVDEIFFNPRAININEYLGFALIVVVAYYNYYRKWEK